MCCEWVIELGTAHKGESLPCCVCIGKCALQSAVHLFCICVVQQLELFVALQSFLECKTTQ